MKKGVWDSMPLLLLKTTLWGLPLKRFGSTQKRVLNLPTIYVTNVTVYKKYGKLSTKVQVKLYQNSAGFLKVQ